MQFLHQSLGEVKSGAWLTQGWIVDGGGEYYLEARYDTNTSRFISFGINGPY